MTPDNIPACDLHAEQCIVGCLLLDNSCIDRIANTLRAEHFYGDVHRMVYATIRQMIRDGKSVDATTLATELEDRALLSDIGGPERLLQALESVTDIDEITFHADTVREKWMEREKASLIQSSMLETQTEATAIATPTGRTDTWRPPQVIALSPEDEAKEVEIDFVVANKRLRKQPLTDGEHRKPSRGTSQCGKSRIIAAFTSKARDELRLTLRPEHRARQSRWRPTIRCRIVSGEIRFIPPHGLSVYWPYSPFASNATPPQVKDAPKSPFEGLLQASKWHKLTTDDLAVFRRRFPNGNPCNPYFHVMEVAIRRSAHRPRDIKHMTGRQILEFVGRRLAAKVRRRRTAVRQLRAQYEDRYAGRIRKTRRMADVEIA